MLATAIVNIMLLFWTLLLCPVAAAVDDQGQLCGHEKWYMISDYQTFRSSAFAQYIGLVYGEIPGPDAWHLNGQAQNNTHLDALCTGGRFQMFYDAEVAKAGVSIQSGRPTPDSMPPLARSDPPGMGCPSSHNLPGERYTKNNLYAPSGLSYVYQQPSTFALRDIPSNAWTEVSHMRDPFGDEAQGMWLLAIKGSGIWFNVGVTRAFNDHGDAYDFFGVPSTTGANQAMSSAATKAGYDSVQFVKHIDPVQYPCDTHHTGVTGRQFMGLEIVAVKHVGKFSCGTDSGASASFAIGWQHSRPCQCDNNIQWLNCAGVPMGHSASSKTVLV